MEILYWILGIHLFEILTIGIIILYRRNSKLENAIAIYQQQNEAISILINDFSTSLNEIDERVYIQADEELKSVFEKINELKNRIEML